MAIFEIINPSDTYTLKTERFDLACCVALMLGSGNFGLREIGGDRHMPIFLFGGEDAWLNEQFGLSLDEFFSKCICAELCQVFASVLIGSPSDRATFESAVSLMNEDAAAVFRADYQDRKRSSMNNIGALASEYEKAVANKLAAAV